MTADQALSPEQFREHVLAGMDPDTRALSLAQESVRFDHPKLAMQLPKSQRGGQRNASPLAGGRRASPGRSGVRHDAPRPFRGSSNTGRGPDGEPVVALHSQRWDYGTLAHEAAHLIRDHETGRAVNEPAPGGLHGSEFVAHYARMVGGISKGAGEDLAAGYAARRQAEREAGE